VRGYEIEIGAPVKLNVENKRFLAVNEKVVEEVKHVTVKARNRELTINKLVTGMCVSFYLIHASFPSSISL
jgi:hypothetical protein